MTLATLRDVLAPALQHGYAVAGMVVLGWEDARAYVEAAELERAPIILQAGPACRAHTPLPVLISMFRALGERAGVPVVMHLDHGYSYDECAAAIDAGFTSVMFDGSRLPLADNIATTQRIVELARAANVSVEGEVGFVGYSQKEPSRGTDPREAMTFVAETGVDALAISVGNVHLQEHGEGGVDAELLAAIEDVVPGPLVLHGGSGLPPDLRLRLATTTRICKFNIGTEVRKVFGSSLREALRRAPEAYDRISILKETIPPVRDATRAVLASMGSRASHEHAHSRI